MCDAVNSMNYNTPGSCNHTAHCVAGTDICFLLTPKMALWTCIQSN
jgi:hypothetical protein